MTEPEHTEQAEDVDVTPQSAALLAELVEPSPETEGQ